MKQPKSYECPTCGKRYKRSDHFASHTERRKSETSSDAEIRPSETADSSLTQGRESKPGGNIMTTQTCPTCGVFHEAPREFKLPTIEAPTDLTAIEAKLEDLSAAVQRLEEANSAAKQQADNRHPKPDIKLFKIWDSCPECAPEWKRVKEEIVRSAQVDCPGCIEKQAEIDRLTNLQTAKSAADDTVQNQSPEQISTATSESEPRRQVRFWFEEPRPRGRVKVGTG